MNKILVCSFEFRYTYDVACGGQVPVVVGGLLQVLDGHPLDGQQRTTGSDDAVVVVLNSAGLDGSGGGG